MRNIKTHSASAPMRPDQNVLSFHPRQDKGATNEQEKIEPPELYMVWIDHPLEFTIDGFLALNTVTGGKILLYSKEEAIIKAKKYFGEVREFTFTFDKEKHIIV